MKIKVSYQKDASLDVCAILEVIEAEDYPSPLIFSRWCLSSEGKYLGVGKRGESTYILRFPANQICGEVEQLINAIRQSLKEWRNINLPPTEIYVL